MRAGRHEANGGGHTGAGAAASELSAEATPDGSNSRCSASFTLVLLHSSSSHSSTGSRTLLLAGAASVAGAAWGPPLLLPFPMVASAASASYGPTASAASDHLTPPAESPGVGLVAVADTTAEMAA